MARPPMSDTELLSQWQLVAHGVAQTQHRISEQIDEAGIPSQWFSALHLLLAAPDRRLPMSRLARDLTMTSGGFTKLADRMAREGLIDRRGSSDDRRVVYATLTEHGAEVGQQLTAQFVAALRAHVTDVISEEGLATMSGAARLLAEAHAGSTPSEDDEGGGVGQTNRDPALPERRGRGRATS